MSLVRRKYYADDKTFRQIQWSDIVGIPDMGSILVSANFRLDRVSVLAGVRTVAFRSALSANTYEIISAEFVYPDDTREDVRGKTSNYTVNGFDCVFPAAGDIIYLAALKQ